MRWYYTWSKGEWFLYDFQVLEEGRRESERYKKYFCDDSSDLQLNYIMTQLSISQAISQEPKQSVAKVERELQNDLLPEDRDLLRLQAANNYLLFGYPDEALQQLDQIAPPERLPGVYHLMARTHRALENHDLASQWMERARQTMPHHPSLELFLEDEEIAALSDEQKASHYFKRCFWLGDESRVRAFLGYGSEEQVYRLFLHYYRQNFAWYPFAEHIAESGRLTPAFIERLKQEDDVAPDVLTFTQLLTLESAQPLDFPRYLQQAKAAILSDSTLPYRSQIIGRLIARAKKEGKCDSLFKSTNMAEILLDWLIYENADLTEADAKMWSEALEHAPSEVRELPLTTIASMQFLLAHDNKRALPAVRKGLPLLRDRQEFLAVRRQIEGWYYHHLIAEGNIDEACRMPMMINSPKRLSQAMYPRYSRS